MSTIIDFPDPLLPIDPRMPLLNAREERFAHALSMGHPALSAYERAGLEPAGCAGTAAQLRRREDIAARVETLRAQAAMMLALQKADAVRYLADVVSTPIAEVGPDSHLCQCYEQTETTRGTGTAAVTTIKTTKRMPDKLAALKMLAQWHGWDDPPPPSPDAAPVSRLTEAVRQLRRAGRVRETGGVGNGTPPLQGLMPEITED